MGAGLMFVLNPTAGAVWFTLFIVAFFVAVGIIRIVSAFQQKRDPKERGWMIFGGTLTILLGVMIYMEWPASGLWVIGLFISVELIIQGIGFIILSAVKNDQEGQASIA